MGMNIIVAILLLSAPAFACTNCLITPVYFSSSIATLGGLALLSRYRQIQGWRALCLYTLPFLLGTVLGTASNLVLQFQYAPTVMAALSSGCPKLTQQVAEPGLTPESTP
jgi:hypothetical protein